MEARFDVLEGLVDEEEGSGSEVDDDMARVFVYDDEEIITDVMRSNKVNREILETEWEAKSLEVMKEETAVKELTAKITDKMLLLDRVIFVEIGDKSGLEKLAKKVSRMSYCLKSFGKWMPRDSWHCVNCLLTGYDRDIQWRMCNLCNMKTHVFCQAFSDSELADMQEDGFECRQCSGVNLLSQIKENILLDISKLKLKSVDIHASHSRLSQELSSLKQRCTSFMGKTRRQLQEILGRNLV